MEEVKQTKYSWVVTILFAVVFLSAIEVSFYNYFFRKDYYINIETTCDQTTQSCYLRDCEDPDSCPPNGLDVYKIYSVKAYDIYKCRDNDCLYSCENNLIECEEIMCGENLEDICSVPQKPTI